VFSYRGLQFQVLHLSFSFQVAVSRLGVEFRSFASKCPVFLAPFIEETTPLPLCVLASRIPGTGEPGGLPSMGSHRVGHD